MDHKRKHADISPMKRKERQDGPQVTNGPMLTSSPGKRSNYHLWLAGNKQKKKSHQFLHFLDPVTSNYLSTYRRVEQRTAAKKSPMQEPEFLGA